ncbi:MAG: TonB-dependent receptor [Prevotellaceae bacterium]|jgi:iron complex outermembrane receptor protein|nr:TonB-dependent receptor [Prevotellaceae bacterium]
MKKYIFLLLFGMQYFIAVSQNQDSVLALQEIVISGEKLSLQSENVSNVEKISLQNNVDIQGLSLAQKLTAVAGVSNLSTGSGIGKPVIRGLSGSRIAVFSQGVRIENQQWGEEHGLGLDEHGYESVEIVKGPASLLYGSDALGGVLAFSGESFAENNSLSAKLVSEYNSNTNGWRNNAGLKMSKKRLHFNVFGTYTTHEDYTDGADNKVDNSRFNTGDIKTTVAYMGANFHSSLHYNFLSENYGLTEPEEEEEGEEHHHSTVNPRTPELPYQHLQTHIAGSNNTWFFANDSRLKVDLGFVSNRRQEFEEEHEHGVTETPEEHEEHEGEAALDMLLNTFSYNARWFSPLWAKHWKLTVGSQGLYQQNENSGEERLIPNATTAEIGVFAVSDFYFSDKSYWQIGVRADNRYINSTADDDFSAFSDNFAAFNFSTGVFLKLPKKFSLRANIASGYRAPNMFELLSNGGHGGANRFEIGNAELKTENSYQVDFSFSYRSEHLELFVNPYFNYIHHYIYLQPTDAIRDEMPVYQYTQDDARLYGGEAGFHLHPHPADWLHLEASYANVFGENADGKDLPLIPSQKINATVSANFKGKKMLRKYAFYLQNQYSFEQKRIADYETPTPAYNVLNAGVSFTMAIKRITSIEVDIACNNIFNEKYYDHLSRYKNEGIYNMGRNFIFRLSVPIEAKL